MAVVDAEKENRDLHFGDDDEEDKDYDQIGMSRGGDWGMQQSYGGGDRMMSRGGRKAAGVNEFKKSWKKKKRRHEPEDHYDESPEDAYN